MTIPKIASLHIYPIKGARGISLDQSRVEATGLAFDRRWMIVDQQGMFVSQRSHPQLTQLQVQVSEDCLVLSDIETQSSTSISLKDSRDQTTQVTIWDDTFEATLMQNEVNQWLSDFLHQDVAMVAMPQHHPRSKKLLIPPYESPVSFADGYPILICGTASLDLLNSKLECTVPMDRFRPNIVLETSKPHVEDTWSEITLGTSKLKLIKPCPRCEVITINQDTGNRLKEPLKTLATYRREGNRVNFGMNTIVLNQGTIKVGDRVGLL